MKIINKDLLKSKIYSTSYFTKTKNILINENMKNIVTMQFKSFCEDDFMLCGIDESISILKQCMSYDDFSSLVIKFFKDGTIIKPHQCVLSITGSYELFCEFENILDSVLARRSSVATNCWKMLKLTTPSQLMFMADRSDDYQLHPYDGYSAYVAGIRLFSNQSHIELLNDGHDAKIVGTMPHALIHQFNGDIVKTLNAYRKLYPDNVVILVDFENDVLKTLSELKPYFDKVQGIRIDTSSSLLDESLSKYKRAEDYGVSHNLILMVRKYLDENDGSHIFIVASSGLDLSKVLEFKTKNTPVDKYGIGSSLIKLNLHFTADLVKLNGNNFAKVGREFLPEDGMLIYEE
ncbi:MAG: hypothetical protein ACRC4M_04410 [Mycoplasma sp.]